MKRWRQWASLVGICSLTLSAALWLVAAPAGAQSLDITMAESAVIESSVFGLGVGYIPDYEGSNEYEAVPLVQARINWSQGYYLSFLGNSLRANMIPSSNWSLGPMARYRKERNNVEDDEVDEMKKVDAAVEVGAFGGYNGEHWLTVLSVVKDVAAGHHGILAELGLGFKVPLQTFGQMTLFASTSYADSDYMKTYFGVDAEDSARSGLSTYSADSGFKDVGAGVTLQHNFSRNWGMLVLARYTRLLDDAEDSPVVDDEGDRDQILGGIVLNYSFR